jgi:hypothetical protein
MTWYREITPLQEPFDIGLDEAGRPMICFNIICVKRPSTTFIGELLKLLQSVGAFGTTIFAGSAAVLPTSGTFLSIVETGGTSPERTQNSVSTPAYQRPSAQIVARADTYVAAKTLANAAYDALVGVRNQNVTP